MSWLELASPSLNMAPPLGTDDSPSLNTAPQKCGHTLFEGPSLIKDLGVPSEDDSIDRFAQCLGFDQSLGK